jgi:hypothetical protein
MSFLIQLYSNKTNKNHAVTFNKAKRCVVF